MLRLSRLLPDTSRNYLVESLTYTGRRFQQKRASVQVKRDDPDLRWCGLCVLSVPKFGWEKHLQSAKHKVNVKKNQNLQNFALGMWEEHRGAPISEESIIEQRIRDGSVAELMAKQQERSESMNSRMLAAERESNNSSYGNSNRSHRHRNPISGVSSRELLEGGDDYEEGYGSKLLGSRGNNCYADNDVYDDFNKDTYHGGGSGGRGPHHARELGRERLAELSAPSVAYNEAYGEEEISRHFGSSNKAGPSSSSSSTHPRGTTEASSSIPADKPLINHAALARQMMLEGVVDDEPSSSSGGGDNGGSRRSHDNSRSSNSRRGAGGYRSNSSSYSRGDSGYRSSRNNHSSGYGDRRRQSSSSSPRRGDRY